MAIRSFTVLCAVAAGMAMACSAVEAAVVQPALIVNLSTPNQVTITATSAISTGTATGSSFVGIYLAGFFSTPTLAELDLGGSGNLTPFGSTASGGAGMFHDSDVLGLNLYNLPTSVTMGFTTGQTAFTGSSTWSVSPATYAEMLAGNAGGNIYFPADWDGDLSSATMIGVWTVVVPTPGAAAVLGVGGLVLGRRRRG